VARVAVNLRGVAASEVRRGDAIVATGSCAVASVLDVELSAPLPPGRHTLHLGSAMVQARVRPLGGDESRFCRLSLAHPAPVRLGDRGMLRDSGRREVLAGVVVLDADPSALRRRGAGSARAAELAAAHERPPGADLVQWRGWATDADVERLGARPDASTRHVGTWWISADRWGHWAAELWQLVRDQGVGVGLSRGEAVLALGLPSPGVLDALLAAGECHGLESVDGRLRVRGERAVLAEPAAAGLADLERRLAENPYQPPDHHQLAALGLDDGALGQATACGRLVRISGDVYLLPDAVDVAVERLRQLPQPFTVAQARDVLDSSRRVVLPLLQLLDASRRTRRVDESHRSVVR
jgi:selenocysteine-specific elongation factor